MTTVDDGLYQYGGAPVGSGLIPFGPDSQAFFVDPANGSDSNDGTTPAHAKASVLAAYNLTTSGNNDVVYFIGGATADTVTATLTWANDYTHLIGLSSPLPGVGQRCRLVAAAANDVTSVITWSSDGSICMNMQFMNGSDADVDSGAVVVSGHRNAFINCMISGMGHATPGARAGSYSLTVSGVENHFSKCYVGLDTITRAAANAELLITGSKDSYWDCTFASFSDTAAHFAVNVTGAGTHTFKRCMFHNMSTNAATPLTDAFSVTVGTTHYILLDPACMSIGYTGWSDTVGSLYSSGPAANAGFGLATNPTA